MLKLLVRGYLTLLNFGLEERGAVEEL